jgi:hypothetical protein
MSAFLTIKMRNWQNARLLQQPARSRKQSIFTQESGHTTDQTQKNPGISTVPCIRALFVLRMACFDSNRNAVARARFHR